MNSPEPKDSAPSAPVTEGKLFSVRANRIVFAIVVMTMAIVAFFAFVVILPGYRNPANRTYTSRFGYSAVQRKLGQPFAIKTELVERRSIADVEMGEGLMLAAPVTAAVLGTGTITAVHVAEGDTVQAGQLLAEVDPARAEVAVRLAQIALASAQAQLERVNVGSPEGLERERPGKDSINLEASRKQVEIWREQSEAMRKLLEGGSISRTNFLEIQTRLFEAERELKASELYLDMASHGHEQSAVIAANEVAGARGLLELRKLELGACKIFAPAAGVVQKVFIRPGEYNSIAGQPGFVIAAGLWFEAHLDQKAIDRVAVGDEAEVELEAIGRPVPGKLTKVISLVSYSAGGPEMPRPVRPIGTGAPEWPSTFRVQIELSPGAGVRLVPGLTGFARVKNVRSVVAVPNAALLSVSSGTAVVHVAAGAQRSVRTVRFGASSHGWTEIKDGLSVGERVIVEGQADLEGRDATTEVSPRVARNP